MFRYVPLCVMNREKILRLPAGHEETRPTAGKETMLPVAWPTPVAVLASVIMGREASAAIVVQL